PDGSWMPAKRRRQAPAQPPVAGAAGSAPDAQAVEGLEGLIDEPVTPPEAPVPHVDPNDLAQLIAFFESAFSGGQDPEVVAQGVRPRLPGDVMTYLRDRVTEHGLAQG